MAATSPFARRALGRRDVLIGGLATAALVGAGCSGSSSSGSSSSTSSAPRSEGGGGRATTRDITTPVGDFTIPVDPQRVVAVEPRLDVESAVAYGLPLIAIGGNSTTMADIPVGPWVPLPDPDVPLLGGVVDDLENILRYEPDLIVCNTGSAEIETLAEVAPLLCFEWDQPWRDIVDDVGALLGRPDERDRIVAEYETVRDEVAERHAAALADRPVAIIQPELDGTYHGAGIEDSPFIHLQVLGDLGGSVVPFLADRQWDERVSFEELSAISDAAAIMVMSFEPDRARNELAGVGPWNELPAVQEGRILFADARLNFGLVYTAQECVARLDELYGLLEG